MPTSFQTFLSCYSLANTSRRTVPSTVQEKSLITNSQTDCTYSLRMRASTPSVTSGLPLASLDSAAELSSSSFPSTTCPSQMLEYSRQLWVSKGNSYCLQENRAACVCEGLITYEAVIRGAGLFSNPEEHGIDSKSAQGTPTADCH